MRPLIEILENERTLMHKLESIYRYLLKDDDPEVVDILTAQKERIERDLNKTRNELQEYIGQLFE